jgi:hypothetical protein
VVLCDARNRSSTKLSLMEVTQHALNQAMAVRP